ncbi:RagB/SusD family nutrient uptake outer membrane protein [Parabacteroides sp.]
MKISKITNWLVAGAACLLLGTSCDVDPTFYSQVVPDTYYTNADAVWSRFNRPFTHWRWWVAQNDARVRLMEVGTDAMCVPTRGNDWFDGAVYQNMHHHHFMDDMGPMKDGWDLTTMGVAQSWNAIENLEEIDFVSVGLTEDDRTSMLNQLNVLAASFYLDGLDLFGGMPLYTSTREDVKGRSTDVETFHFIDSLLDAAIPNLPLKTELGAPETNTIHRAVAAALKARLYFNAESYIKQPMYEEAAQVCQDIIDGKYGQYKLAGHFTEIFGWGNETCPEIIWTVPSENAKGETDGGLTAFTLPYNFKDFLGGLQDAGGNNGLCLCPSRDPEGNVYKFNVGNPYETFNDKDIRKQQYVYEGGRKYRGMFIVGELQNPDFPDFKCLGAREYAGKVLNVVDQIAHLSQVGNTVASVKDLTSTIGDAEENSGVRVIKVSPLPNQDEFKERFNPDCPFIRLTEIYYILAECKMRLGDKPGAAELINMVRKRNFEGNDPDPVTATNLDKYRMLKEWMQEFLREARRRTDLIRWNAYVTEDWWDHKATNNANYNRFPLHQLSLGANPLLEQNPGY